MTASLERAGELDDRVREFLIASGQWPPAPERLGPLPAMIRPLPDWLT
jgi:hypothetical protein